MLNRFDKFLRGSSCSIVVAKGLVGVMLLAACSGGNGGSATEPAGTRPAGTKLRVYHDPYRAVDWEQDFRLKGQHHDHLMPDFVGRLRAYDAAGYDAVSLMDYSGAPNLSYSLKTRLWPPDMVVPPDVLAALSSLRIFIPNSEEVGLPDGHFTTPFMTQYVEYFPPGGSGGRQAWHYSSPQELSRLVDERGGMLFAAHAWTPGARYLSGPRLTGVEIYNPVAEYRRRRGEADYLSVDRNRVLIENWDRALASDHRLIGIAVNDHFGPYQRTGTSNDDIRDSGKVVVIGKSATLDGYREAIERRALVAVKDLGVVKDRVPQLVAIESGPTGLRIDTDAEVRWISHGTVVSTSAELQFSVLPLQSRYVRAELHNADQSVVYTQAFSVRPVGDANGDDRVDAADTTLCREVEAGREADPEIVAACEAIQER